MDKQSTFEDTKRLCLECGREFTFTAGEQFFYAGKGLVNPKRCPDCRKRRKETIARPELEVQHER